MSLSDGRKALEFKVEKGEDVRLDVWLAAETEYTRSKIKRLIDDGDVTVNGEKSKCGRILKENDAIRALIPETTESLPQPKEIPLDVLYEDDDVIVVNKQQGLTVHQGAGTGDDTLINALMWRGTKLSSVGAPLRAGIVHRLDKDTSGVMIAAKTDAAHLSLAEQFAERTARKVYRAILIGNPKDEHGVLTTFISRDPKDRKLMKVASEGRTAITEYTVKERFDRYCYAEFVLHTGRTHQIRVHCKYLGHPILGDKSYGGEDRRFPSLEGQLLHSYSLTVTHPTTGKKMTFTAPPPEAFKKTYKILSGKEWSGS